MNNNILLINILKKDGEQLSKEVMVNTIENCKSEFLRVVSEDLKIELSGIYRIDAFYLTDSQDPFLRTQRIF